MLIQWVIGILVSIISIIVTILLFHTKNKNEELKNDSMDLWEHLECLQKEKERIDRSVVALTKEVEMLKKQIEQQFSALDKSQKEVRDFLSRQVEETKDLIKALSTKIDRYLEDNQKTAIQIAEHIAKNGNGK